jgi:hypothetical protein
MSKATTGLALGRTTILPFSPNLRSTAFQHTLRNELFETERHAAAAIALARHTTSRSHLRRRRTWVRRHTNRTSTT